MSSNEPQQRPRRSRKSIAVMPTSSLALAQSGGESSTAAAAAAPKASRKSRSKSLGPGGLDALNAAGGRGLKDGSGNGRRGSLAPAAAVKSILKPTLPLSPIQPIPAHRTRTTTAPPFTIAPMAPAPTRASTVPAAASSNTLNFNPPPATIPVRTEEEQQRRSEILAARAARRQSLGNRRVSFAPEATLHTWDVVEYYRGDGSTPGNSTGRLSTIEATPTGSVAADPESPKLPGRREEEPNDTFAPVTPGRHVGGGGGFESPATTDAEFSSPFSSEAASSPFAGLPTADSDSDSNSDSDEEAGAGDRTFMTNAGDTTMGDMTMDMDVDVTDDELTTGAGGFGAFGKRKAWKLEGATEAIDEDETKDVPATEDGEGEMTMEMTCAVGGVLPAASAPVAYPALPDAHSDNEDEGGEMTMEMTRAIGGVLPGPAMFTEPEAQDDTVDMDMTRPVGGILSTAATLLERAKRRSLGFFQAAPAKEEEEDGEDVDMDMTVAVGGILSRPQAQREISSSPPAQGDMTMDMDMTVAVGGILPQQQQQKARFVDEDSESEDGNEEMTMEFTSVLGGIIGRSQEEKVPEEKKGKRRSSLAKNGGGGRLMSADAWQKEQDARRGKEEEEQEDDDGGDMDMTVAIGGILSAPVPVQQQQGGDSTDEEDVDMDGVTMDITTAIGSILPSRPAYGTSSAAGSSTKPKEEEWSPVAPPKEEQRVGTPTPIKRRSSSRRSSAASVSSEPRVTRRTSAMRKSLEMQQQEQEQDIKTKSSSPVVEAAPAPAKVATPEPEPEVQKAQTPAQTPKKKATLKSQTKKETPKKATPTPTPTPTPTTKAETPKPMFVFATPQKRASTTTTPAHPQTPPAQSATPAVKPKTPSKHTPAIETPLRRATPRNHGFSLSAKKAVGLTSPSPYKQANTPSSGLGIGIAKLGLGSPSMAAKLSARKGIEETTLPFSPIAAPRDLLRVSKEDDAEDREEERREREKEMERRKSLDLRSRIELLTPRKAGRKSLAYGALLQGQGKRERDEDLGSFLGGGKRRKSLEYGLSAQAMTPAKGGLRSMDLDKAPSLPTPKKQSPKKKVMIAEMPVVQEVVAPPADEVMEEAQNEEEEESYEEEEEEQKLSLQQFLSMTSISFLDGLTTTKRRATGFPGLELRRGRRMTDTEDEQAASLADCVVAGACTVPMLDLFQHTCRELKKYIKEGCKVVKEIEAETLEENPLLFREYLDAPPDVKVIMDSQFKNVKTNARFQAKGIWYDWRMKLLEGVRAALESNLQGLKADEAAVEEGRKAAESMLPGMKERFENAKKTAAKLEEMKRTIESDDKEQLSEARERLKTVQQRIEEVKKKLARRREEMEEVDAGISVQEEKKAALQASIEEAERIKEVNRGWSEDEVAGWKEKVITLEQKYGWSINTVHGTSVELVFFKQLCVKWDATGTQSTTVEYMVPAIVKASDPIPLQNAERDFFISRLNARLSDTAVKRTLKQTLSEIDTFWRHCLSITEEIRKVRRMYPVTLTPHNGDGLKVAIRVLVPQIRSKVVIEVLVDKEMTAKGGAKVIYGGVNEAVVGEFVGNELSGEGKEGRWRFLVDNVVERCLEGKRRGGVGVPTKA